MKFLSAGLTFFSFSTVSAVLLGIAAGGLGPETAFVSLFIGAVLAVLAFFTTFDPGPARVDLESKSSPAWRYRSIWFWLVVGCFTIFAVRSFGWLLFIDGPDLRIQSVNNLGDLSLHVTYIKTFANGIALWPDNPIYVFSRLQYPAGVDLFNGLLDLVGIDLIRGLVWVGLLSSLATLYAFYRWGGNFGIAAFLFNGGLAGFAYVRTFAFKDYQGVNSIAWKSIPLSMFVTQRGLLYSIPAALLLLWHWREKFFARDVDAISGRVGSSDVNVASVSRPPLPFWVELGLYGSMPLFHVHTFLALTVVLVFLFALGDTERRIHTATLVAAAFIPATFFVWLITDHFRAASMLKWQPGWVQRLDDFAHPLGFDQNASGFWRGAKQLFDFWFINFGFFMPLIAALIAILAFKAWRARTAERTSGAIPIEIAPAITVAALVALITPFLSLGWCLFIFAALAIPLSVFAFHKARGQWLPVNMSLTFVVAAFALFLFGYLFKTAPWAWDNLKLMFWGYFLVLPFLWRDLIAKWAFPVRVAVCIALFASGFVSLFGGLATPGFGFANRAELDGVAVGVRNLPVEARFATYPTFNHPVLLQGRKCVLGYPGHLWTQGFDYHLEEAKLKNVMLGESDWRDAARALRVRYIFWGREEQTNYPASKRPWEQVLPKVESGAWGAIYDLGADY